MIRKEIQFEQFNFAEILTITEDNTAVCELVQLIIDEDGIETEIHREKYVSFDNGCWPFELTQEEINSFNVTEEMEVING